MLEIGKDLVNKSDMTLRLLQKNDFFEFRRAATESTESNYEYLAYGQLFENLNIFDLSPYFQGIFFYLFLFHIAAATTELIPITPRSNLTHYVYFFYF